MKWFDISEQLLNFTSQNSGTKVKQLLVRIFMQIGKLFNFKQSQTWEILRDVDDVLHLVEVGDSDGIVVALFVHLTKFEQLKIDKQELF